MRLQLDILKIQDVRFGDRTEIVNGVLKINRSELEKLLKEDRRLGGVEIELAHPGERCRIIQVTDVVEPRAKKKGGSIFRAPLEREEGLAKEILVFFGARRWFYPSIAHREIPPCFLPCPLKVTSLICQVHLERWVYTGRPITSYWCPACQRSRPG